ncbi:MAG: GNAT family N-acetyltransferase [Thermodesulfovibrionales bacterium]|nr:GNAT family N-acetyltransferase [Thermodesulfovibrionales bacterium]
MIKELQWDSAFFKKKIGTLIVDAIEVKNLSSTIEKARNAGFHYLTFKTKSFDMPVIQALESAGFSLTDIGVTFRANSDIFSSTASPKTMKWRKSLRVAGFRDIPMLRTLIKGLFPQSRFYHDPFFSKKDADNLYQQWIENSVKGTAADIVFCVDKAGFITCRKKDKLSGEIVLIGIGKRTRGKGLGTVLVAQAMQWFRDKGMRTVTVRTQLRNPDAMNFYIKLGFLVKEYDLIFGNKL